MEEEIDLSNKEWRLTTDEDSPYIILIELPYGPNTVIMKDSVQSLVDILYEYQNDGSNYECQIGGKDCDC